MTKPSPHPSPHPSHHPIRPMPLARALLGAVLPGAVLLALAACTPAPGSTSQRPPTVWDDRGPSIAREDSVSWLIRDEATRLRLEDPAPGSFADRWRWKLEQRPIRQFAPIDQTRESLEKIDRATRREAPSPPNN